MNKQTLYTYPTMPEYKEPIPEALYTTMTGNEIGLQYSANVIYDEKDDIPLHLQIIQPAIFSKPDQLFPCIVFVQGSAWMKQNVYINVPYLERLACHGFFCAIVEHRPSDLAKFPSQVIDVKNAIRFLKKNASTYHIDPNKVFLMGDSSGGHLAVLAGMTSKTELLDDPLFETDCYIRGILDLYGSVEVSLETGYPGTDYTLDDNPLGLFMGYNVSKFNEKAKIADALSYCDKDFPPVLIVHGTKDPVISCEQSVRLYNALKKTNHQSTLCLVQHADHGGAPFWTDEMVNIYLTFIRNCLA